MINFSCWNIRGLNGLEKQEEIGKLISDQQLYLMGIVETKVRVVNSDAIKRSIFRHWRSFNNYLSHPLGRIWVGWNPNVVEVAKVEETDKVVH